MCVGSRLIRWNRIPIRVFTSCANVMPISRIAGRIAATRKRCEKRWCSDHSEKETYANNRTIHTTTAVGEEHSS